MNLSPSILDLEEKDYNEFFNVATECNLKSLHIDCMDGVFVLKKAFLKEDFDKLLNSNYQSLLFDVHLMAMNPDKIYESYLSTNTRSITFHIESDVDVDTFIQELKKNNVEVGLSINPETSLDGLLPYLRKVDRILVMSVHPGLGGQKYINATNEKIHILSNLKKTVGFKYEIEVDGGINPSTIPFVKKAGADSIVVGSYLTEGHEFKKRIEEVLKCMNESL